MIIDSLAHSHTEIIAKLNRQVLILWVDFLYHVPIQFNIPRIENAII